MSSVVAPGMVFQPNDMEILSFYLPSLIASKGNVKAVLGNQFSDLIQASNVYSCNPWFYFSNDHDQSHDTLGKGNQRFVFSPREKISQNKSNAKRPKRGVAVLGSQNEAAEVGFWKSSTGERPVLDDHGDVLGFLNILNFYEYTDCKNKNGKRNRKDGTKKTNWLMYEYRLKGDDDEFQDWVICKIKYTRRGKKDEGEDWPRMEPKSDDPISLKYEGSFLDATMEVDDENFVFTEEDIEEMMKLLPNDDQLSSLTS